MSYATWIADALRGAGLDVDEAPGWKTRGSVSFAPRGVVCHHTASNPPAAAPSLGICINGRSDLPGPLCHVLIGRDLICYVIAAGRANHAGDGGWRGLEGNSSVLGIEVENNGLGEPWAPELVGVFARCAAALAARLGDPTAGFVCLHREWAPTRKPDPAGPGFPQDGTQWRAMVSHFIDNPGGDDMTKEEHDWLVELSQEVKGVPGFTKSLREEIDEVSAQGKNHQQAIRARFDDLEAKIDALGKGR